jgi:hypothetical protein
MIFIDLHNPVTALGPRAFLASNRNEYQKDKTTFLGSDLRVHKVTTPPPSVSGLSRQCGILDSSQSYSPPRPVTRIWLYFTYFPYKLQYFVLLGFKLSAVVCCGLVNGLVDMCVHWEFKPAEIPLPGFQ